MNDVHFVSLKEQTTSLSTEMGVLRPPTLFLVSLHTNNFTHGQHTTLQKYTNADLLKKKSLNVIEHSLFSTASPTVSIMKRQKSTFKYLLYIERKRIY